MSAVWSWRSVWIARDFNRAHSGNVAQAPSVSVQLSSEDKFQLWIILGALSEFYKCTRTGKDGRVWRSLEKKHEKKQNFFPFVDSSLCSCRVRDTFISRYLPLFPIWKLAFSCCYVLNEFPCFRAFVIPHFVFFGIYRFSDFWVLEFNELKNLLFVLRTFIRASVSELMFFVLSPSLLNLL